MSNGGPAATARAHQRATKRALNRAHHAGVHVPEGLPPRAKLASVDAQLAGLVEEGADALEKARILGIRTQTIEAEAREIREVVKAGTNAVEPTPEELDAECQAWLVARGAVVTWPEHAFTLPAGEPGPKVGT